MKHFLLLTTVLMILVFSNKLKAQEKQDLNYFYIENLSVENYQNLFLNKDKSTSIEIDYVCIPAKIIGVKKVYAKLLENKLKAVYKDVQRQELSQEEAEQQCANFRDH